MFSVTFIPTFERFIIKIELILVGTVAHDESVSFLMKIFRRLLMSYKNKAFSRVSRLSRNLRLSRLTQTFENLRT